MYISIYINFFYFIFCLWHCHSGIWICLCALVVEWIHVWYVCQPKLNCRYLLPLALFPISRTYFMLINIYLQQHFQRYILFYWWTWPLNILYHWTFLGVLLCVYMCFTITINSAINIILAKSMIIAVFP